MNKLLVATSFSGRVNYETGQVEPEFRKETEKAVYSFYLYKSRFASYTAKEFNRSFSLKVRIMSTTDKHSLKHQ